MTREYGYLVASMRNFGPGNNLREETTYCWQGPPVSLMHSRCLEELLGRTPRRGDVFELGPYTLVVFGPGDLVDSVEVVLVDAPWEWWRVHFAWLRTALRWFSARLILTMAVWGLIPWPLEGSEPTWHKHVWDHWFGEGRRA